MNRRQVLLLALVLAAAFRTSMVGAIDITGKWNTSSTHRLVRCIHR